MLVITRRRQGTEQEIRAEAARVRQFREKQVRASRCDYELLATYNHLNQAFAALPGRKECSALGAP
jgi:hypothetical protein